MVEGDEKQQAAASAVAADVKMEASAADAVSASNEANDEPMVAESAAVDSPSDGADSGAQPAALAGGEAPSSGDAQPPDADSAVDPSTKCMDSSDKSNADAVAASTSSSSGASDAAGNAVDHEATPSAPMSHAASEAQQPNVPSLKRKEPPSPSAATNASNATVKTEENATADPATAAAAAEATPKKLKLSTEAPKTQPSSSATNTEASVPATEAQPNGVSVGDAAVVSAPLMISRDDMARMEEDGGKLKFTVISNDGEPEHMVQLTTLKNIFARQLPKMPREYIVRLVFDRNHRSMVILKNGKHVIGGICYRPFEPNHFAEIAFCAINAADQVKGYGTRLMNHLKEYVKASGITHFLTYADNYAIGYFKKQGFAKVVSMPKSNWFGYIKDYDGGTLMECTIHHQINYLRITSMVQEQRKKIQEKIKERSKAHIVYPGLTQFAEGRTMDIYMVPGVKEAGWSHAVIRNSRVGTRDPGSLRTQLQQLWKAVSSHRSAWPFHEPVDTTIVVDYLDYIKEPVDLSLIQKRIESGYYLNKAAFKADLDTMCNNCTIYNTPDTNYYKAAKDLQEFIDKRIQVAK